MKNLVDYINEQLIVEMSLETYKKAADKARQIGDPRWEKFLNAYVKELKKLDDLNADSGDKKVFKMYQEDKQFFRKLRQEFPDIKRVSGGITAYNEDETIKLHFETNIANGYDYEDKTRLFLPREWPSWSGEEKPSFVDDGDKLIVVTIFDYGKEEGDDNGFATMIYDVTKDNLAKFSYKKFTDRGKEVAADIIKFANPNSKFADSNGLKRS